MITEKKIAPANIFHTKTKKNRNISTVHTSSIIKENNKKAANGSTRNERFKNDTMPSDDPTQ